MKAILFAFLLIATPATWGLTAEEIDALLAKGRAATSAKKVPRVLVVASKMPKGSFAASVLIGASSTPYTYGVQTCRTLVPALGFLAKLRAESVDREYIDESCLDKDFFFFVVTNTDSANARVINSALGYYTLDAPDVTDSYLRVDGKPLHPSIPLTNQAGLTFLTYDYERVASAKTITVVAVIGDAYTQEVTLKPKHVRRLFGNRAEK